MNPIPINTLLTKNKKCIINTDLDGILSGIILHNTLNWEIVGFCDSGEYLWIDKSKFVDIKEVVFIDMFVAPKEFKCIDQHIISFDYHQNKQLSSNPNKLNPNLLSGNSLTPPHSYLSKYPFGTFHFIIASLERLGYSFDFDLNKETLSGLKLMDFLLRADDTLLTSTFSNYKTNAHNWWQWLIKYSNIGSTTKQFYEHIIWVKSNLWLRQIKLQKRTIANLLISSPFYCSSNDGGYTGLREMGNRNLKKYVKEYIYFIAEITGMNCFDLELNFKVIKGNTNRCTFTYKTYDELMNINDYTLFSYAFVRSIYRNDNFSFTLMPNNALYSFR